jgi:HlyD family secretion protein
MTRQRRRIAIAIAIAIAVVALGLSTTAGAATILTGEVHAVDAQPVETPPSNSSPVVLRYFLAEGTRVKPGDVLVRIDPGQAAGQLRQLGAQIEQAQAKAAKEVAELRVKAVDAELAQVDAQAALESARVDASIPHQLISALDFDRYRGERDRAGRELTLKTTDLAAARAAVDRRVVDGQLEVGKLVAERDFKQAEVQLAEVRADRAGILVHAFDSQSDAGGRYDEGSSSFPGVKIGEVVGSGPMAVRAYALEPDRVALAPGQSVGLVFDAWPSRRLQGRIATISGAPQAKAEWGDGRYFQIDITISDPSHLPLRPGMSVRVETGAEKTGALAQAALR